VRKRERECEKEGERERERDRDVELLFLFLFLKGITGALAPFTYLVYTYCNFLIGIIA
jgi:hypothetical protein